MPAMHRADSVYTVKEETWHWNNWKRELERFGEQNDGAQHSRGSKMLNIPATPANCWRCWCRRGAQAVLEIGTSNGYSTLWLAEAVKRLGGRVTTIELDEGNGPWRRPTLSGPGLTPGLRAAGGGWQPVALPADGGLSAHLPRLRAPPLPGLVARDPAPACPSWPAGGGQCHLP